MANGENNRFSEIESRQIKTDLQRLITRAQRWNQMISMRKVIWPKDDPELYAVLIKLLKDAYSTRAPYSAVFQVNTDYFNGKSLAITIWKSSRLEDH